VLIFSGFFPTRLVQANSSVNVDISVFHDSLAPYGNWVNHRTYGQVWYPRNVARNWRPYTDGYWAHTEDYGWLWVSNEPWGWAPFHYGRWAWDNWYGWIWAPGRTWAPAWVFWRSGGGYAAWSPMPPNVVWQAGRGLNTSYFNFERDLRWDSWVAVREYDLTYRNLNTRICPPRQNLQIINVTNYTNNIAIVNNTIVNQGVSVKQIEAVTHRPVESVVPKIYASPAVLQPDIHHNEKQPEIHTLPMAEQISHNETLPNQPRKKSEDEPTPEVSVTNPENHRNDTQPKIFQLPIAAAAAEEIQHDEELARRLDGKNEDGTRTEIPIANSGQADEHDTRIPGRLVGVPAPAQAPYATPEHPKPALTEPVERALAQPAIPETPLIGLSLDSDLQHQQSKPARNQEAMVPAQPAGYQSPVIEQPKVFIPPKAEDASAPGAVTDPHSVSTDETVMPPLQNGLQLLESSKQTENQPLQYPGADQQQQDPLQQELADRQNKQLPVTAQQLEPQNQPPIEMQSQPVGRLPEPVPQLEPQNQPPIEMQSQPVERMPEPVPQPEPQNQPPIEMQSQPVERLPEPVPQLEPQNQPPIEMQPQPIEPVPETQKEVQKKQEEVTPQ